MWVRGRFWLVVAMSCVMLCAPSGVAPSGALAGRDAGGPLPSAPEVVSTCADSDGGRVPEVRGCVSGTGRAGYLYEKCDQCLTDDDAGYLKEFYCSGDVAVAAKMECPNGCLEGACLSAQPSCTDADDDSYSPDGGACGLSDCNDADSAIHPGATDVCGNGVDEDCDGEDRECPSGLPNIIIIGWDGTQRDHLWQCYNETLPECSGGLPNLRALSGGARIWNNTTTSGDTATKPGWAQILTGYDAEVTGVYNNGTYRPIPEGYTIFEKAESVLGPANVVTMFVSGKGEHTGGACAGEWTTKNGQPYLEPIGEPWCLAKFHVDYYENDLRQNDVVGNRALELLEVHRDDQLLAFFLFRDPDVTGHVSGEDSPRYSQAIITVDQWLGRIVAKVDELGLSDQTLIYVITDHGFDEGQDRHGNAPFGFMATNDSAVIRSGDRKDLAPTVLEHLGISVGPLGSAPAVDGYSLLSVPPVECVCEGDAYLYYHGAPPCCPGLEIVSLDKVVGPIQIDATGGSLPAAEGTDAQPGYCTACGDGACKEPENALNCPADCR